MLHYDVLDSDPDTQGNDKSWEEQVNWDLDFLEDFEVKD